MAARDVQARFPPGENATTTPATAEPLSCTPWSNHTTTRDPEPTSATSLSTIVGEKMRPGRPSKRSRGFCAEAAYGEPAEQVAGTGDQA